MESKVNVDNKGRVSLLLNIKKELNLLNEDTVILRVINGELKMLPMSHLIKEIQSNFLNIKNITFLW